MLDLPSGTVTLLALVTGAARWDAHAGNRPAAR